MRQPVMVGVDGSPCGRTAARWAAREALLRSVPLRVVYVSPLAADETARLWPGFDVPLPDLAVRELAAEHPELDIAGVRLAGAADAALLSCAAECSLLVLGVRGEGDFELPSLGSTALDVAGRHHGPTVLVPAGAVADSPAETDADTDPEHVTLGLDPHRPSDAATDFAFTAAALREGPLHTVHAWSVPSPAARWMPYAVPSKDREQWEDHEVQRLADVLRPWQDKYERVRVVRSVVLRGRAAALVHASRSSGLVVVGRPHDRLDTAAHTLVQYAGCPVAVVPG
ncbi:universal stress protein [Streptomyces sp. TRM66268-LWL]|uniref:Universal stress protein n=1 Tax=Streptomyces polyasparticus TaxID=2767826 RepID=A0ABR7SIH7_9ACTN|nr:universal stress protein [Streptomyces polyasparticus]MBC9715326.1 universal stress protein [Streptomyces polyasparticus]